MKVLMLNGSPRVGGNTSIALREMENVFKASGVDVETVQVGNRDIPLYQGDDNFEKGI